MDLINQSIRLDVDIVDLFEFAQASKRNWLEGNELYKNNHVIFAGVTKTDGESTHVYCSCLRGSNPSEPPREVNMITSPLFKDWKIHCSCPAGNFRCKHQFACLLSIHNKKELEFLTATEVRQQWGKVAKVQAQSLYEPVPLSAMCNQRTKNSSATITDELCNKISNLFVTELPESALAKFFKGRNVLECGIQKDRLVVAGVEPDGFHKFIPVLPEWQPRQRKQNNQQVVSKDITTVRAYLKSLFEIPNVTTKWKYYCGPMLDPSHHTFYEARVCLSGRESVSICLETLGQSNDIWRRERRIRITASVCYELYTYYKNDPGDRDWQKKLSSIVHPLLKRLPSLQYGKDMEDKALDCYKAKNPGKSVIKMGLAIPPSAPFLGCSPDAIIAEDKKLIEIKCPVSGKDQPVNEMIPKLKFLEKNGGEIFLKKKHAYYGQIQLGMCLLNLESTDFVIYSSCEDNYHLVTVPFDDDFVAELFPVLREIYFNIFLPMLCSE